MSTLSLTFGSTPGSVTLPLSGTFTSSTNWGDGITNDSLSHTYEGAGPFTAVITISTGSVNTFGGSYNWAGYNKLLSVSTTDTTTWGLCSSTTTSTLTNMNYMFINSALLTSIPDNIPGSVVNMFQAFNGSAYNGTQISSWNTSNVTNMSYMFSNNSTFNQDISTSSKTINGVTYTAWNVSNVVDMSHMFYSGGDSVFNQDISSWDVSNVTNMENMFQNSPTFNNGDSGNNGANPLTWTPSNVTSLYAMFWDATAFNQNIGSWNVGNLANMTYMFYNDNGGSLFNNGNSSSIQNWNICKATSLAYTFWGCSSFNQPLKYWFANTLVSDISTPTTDATNGTITDYIPSTNNSGTGCELTIVVSGNVVTELYATSRGSGYVDGDTLTIASADIGGTTDVVITLNSNSVDDNGGVIGSKVTSLDGAFYGASSFNQDISSWNTYGLGTLSSTFNGASSFNQDISSWNTYGLKTLNSTFYGASSFNQDISSWNVTNLTSLTSAFYNASAFNNGGQALNWNLTLTGSLSYTFNGASAFNQDISGWSVNNVTSMNSTFNGASAFNQDISEWSVNNVTTMDSLFNNASTFNQDISGWSVSNVTDMDNIFNGASAFNQDISDWNIWKITNMTSMFSDAIAFNQDLTHWNLSIATTMMNPTNFSNCRLKNMFTGTTALYNSYQNTLGFSGSPSTAFFNQGMNFYINVSASDIITLPFGGIGTLYVNWGDGSAKDTYSSGDSVTHTYSSDGNYRILAWGSATTFGNDTSTWASGADKLTRFEILGESMATWGITGLTSLAGAFYGCSSLETIGNITGTDSTKCEPIKLAPTITTIKNMFYGCTSLASSSEVERANLSGWDVANVVDMEGVFYGATNINTAIGAWDVANVTTFENMFNGATTFDQDLRFWTLNASTPTLTNMFTGATAMLANSIWSSSGIAGTPPSSFFGKATTPLFISFRSISSITIPFNYESGANSWSNVKIYWGDGSVEESFNSGTSTSNPSKSVSSGNYTVTIYGDDGINNASATCLGQSSSSIGWDYLLSITTKNNSTWGLSGLTTMKYLTTSSTNNYSYVLPTSCPSTIVDLSYAFYDSQYMNWDINSWNTDNVTNMYQTFFICYRFNNKLTSWNTSNVTDMYQTFYLTYMLMNDLTNWTTANVTSMYEMFYNSYRFNGKVTNFSFEVCTDTENMFYNNYNFNNNSVSNWDVSPLTILDSMFYNCKSFNQDVSSWLSSSTNVTNLKSTFRGCSKFNQDLSSWDVSNITSMNSTFSSCTNFNNGGAALPWKITSCTNLAGLFSSCSSFNQDVGTRSDGSTGLYWDVSNVTDMSYFLSYTAYTQTSNIPYWNMSSMKNLYGLLQGTNINIAIPTQSVTVNGITYTAWDTSNVTDMGHMFSDTPFNQDLSSWDFKNVTTMAYMFLNNTSFNQDLTSWNTSSLVTTQYMFQNATAFNNGDASDIASKPLTWNYMNPHYLHSKIVNLDRMK